MKRNHKKNLRVEKGDIVVIIKYSEPTSKSDKVTVKGYAVDQNTNQRIFPGKYTQQTGAPNTLKNIISYVANIEYEKFQMVSGRASTAKPAATSTEKPTGVYTEAYETITDKNALNPGWEASTFGNIHAYFRLNLLPMLDKYGREITPEDILQIQENLINKAIRSKKGHQTRDSAQNTVAGKLGMLQEMYARLQKLCCGSNLPYLELRGDMHKKATNHKQIKSLPNKIRVIFVELLFRLMPTPCGGLAFALALMHLGGLRTSEATAMLWSDIKIHPSLNFAYASVTHQEKNGRLSDILKTQSSYRNIVLPKIIVDMIGMRKDYLRSQGLSDTEIENMPCACTKTSAKEMASSEMVSKLGHELLESAGCDKSFWERGLNTMIVDPDLDANLIMSKDLTAYILRRDFASRNGNVCKIPAEILDHLLGHKNKNSKSVDFHSINTLREIADAMERYIFSPEHSLNPAIKPIMIRKGETQECLPAFVEQTITADCDPGEEIDLEIQIDLCEPADTITITSPQTLQNAGPSVERPAPGSQALSDKTPIGKSADLDQIKAWIKDAQEIDLSTL